MRGDHQSQIDVEDIADDNERKGEDETVQFQILLPFGDGDASENDVVGVCQPENNGYGNIDPCGKLRAEEQDSSVDAQNEKHVEWQEVGGQGDPDVGVFNIDAARMAAHADVGCLAEEQRGDGPMGEFMTEYIERDATVFIEDWQPNKESCKKGPGRIGVGENQWKPDNADEHGQCDEPHGQRSKRFEDCEEKTFHERREDGRKMLYTLYILFHVMMDISKKRLLEF